MAPIRKMKNYINGQWVASESGKYAKVYNPATEEILAEVCLSNEKDVTKATAAAAKAFLAWRKVAVPARARYMFKLQNILIEQREELARLITLENGKSINDSRGEVQRGIESVEAAAGITTQMMGDSISTAATEIEVTNYRYPIGVIGCITPFNFPMMVPFWLFPLAVAAGNTVVIKPSEKTPLLVEKIMEFVEAAGIPAGVVNVVHGAHEVVNALLTDPMIEGISFVGSKQGAEHVYKTGTANLKRVQALSGANNHVLVLKDANLDQAVSELIGAGFGSAGERCMAAAVIAVEEEIADEFVAKFKLAAEKIKIGDGLIEENFLGPVIREEARTRSFNYIDIGLKEKATLVLDGRENLPARGYFVGPTIFDHVTTEMRIWKEEMFAPIVSIARVKDLKAGVELANESELANGACIFTNNASAIRYFRENIDAGMLGINLGVPAPIAWFPFSGWKNSFYGDLHANGKDGVEFVTRRKVMTARYQESEI